MTAAWAILERLLREATTGPTWYRGLTNVPLQDLEALVNSEMEKGRGTDEQLPMTGGRVDKHRQLNPSAYPRWSIDPGVALADASSETMKGREREVDPRSRTMDPGRGQTIGWVGMGGVPLKGRSVDPVNARQRIQAGGYTGFDVLIAAQIPDARPNMDNGVLDIRRVEQDYRSRIQLKNTGRMPRDPMTGRTLPPPQEGGMLKSPKVTMTRLAFVPSQGPFEKRKADLLRLMGTRAGG